MNDLNIMDVSSFFSDVLAGKFTADEVHYMIDGEPFDWSYLKADGIYPCFKNFAIPIQEPSTRTQRRYERCFSGVRGSVERVFGVLLIK